MSFLKNLVFLFYLIPALEVSGNPPGEYQSKSAAGDFSAEGLLREKIELSLSMEKDAFLRSALKRRAYMETIELPGDLIFDSDISALSSDGDDIWIGSRSGDIARYSLSERQLVSFVKGQESLAIKAVQQIIPDEEYVWFLSHASVSVYFKGLGSYQILDNPDNQDYQGFQSAVVRDSGLIAGTQKRGLRSIRLDGYSLVPQKTALRNITFLKPFDSVQILAGSEEQGLFLLDGDFSPRPLVANPQKTAAVRTVLGNEEEMIAGSYGNGIFKLVKTEGNYDIVFPETQTPWITDGVALSKGLYCFSTLGQGLLCMDKDSLDSRYYAIEDGLGGLNVTSLAFVEPFLICAIQGQGLLKIHENYFSRP